MDRIKGQGIKISSCINCLMINVLNKGEYMKLKSKKDPVYREFYALYRRAIQKAEKICYDENVNLSSVDYNKFVAVVLKNLATEANIPIPSDYYPET